MSNAFKVILVGDAGVGKTALQIKKTDHVFEKKYIATMGVEVTPFTFNDFYPDCGDDVKHMPMNIWDTAGQEKFCGLKGGYYVGANGAIVMFDMTSSISYRNTRSWIREIRAVCPNIPIVLVGNKSDCQRHANVPDDGYYAISVKNNHNIDEPFRYLINAMIADQQ